MCPTSGVSLVLPYEIFFLWFGFGFGGDSLFMQAAGRIEGSRGPGCYGFTGRHRHARAGSDDLAGPRRSAG